MLKHLFKNGGLQFVSEMHYQDVFVYNSMSTEMVMILYELSLEIVRGRAHIT